MKITKWLAAPAAIAVLVAIGGASGAYAHGNANGGGNKGLTASIVVNGQTVTVTYDGKVPGNDKEKGRNSTPIYVTVRDASMKPQPLLLLLGPAKYPETKVLSGTIPASAFDGCKPLVDVQVDGRAGGTTHNTSYLVKAGHFNVASPNTCTQPATYPEWSVTSPTCKLKVYTFKSVDNDTAYATPSSFTLPNRVGANKDVQYVARDGFSFNGGQPTASDNLKVTKHISLDCSVPTLPVKPVVVVVKKDAVVWHRTD